MTRILLLVVFFGCTGCSFFSVSQAVKQCDRPNVYCGGSDQAERDFKRSEEIAALVNDFKNTTNFIENIVEEAKTVENKDDEHHQAKGCSDGETRICTSSKGCFCE